MGKFLRASWSCFMEASTALESVPGTPSLSLVVVIIITTIAIIRRRPARREKATTLCSLKKVWRRPDFCIRSFPL